MQPMTNNRRQEKLKIGITMGDINGVGPEVIIKAFTDTRLLNFFTPVIYGSTKILSFYRKLLKIDEFNYSQVKNPGNFLAKKVNVVNCWEDSLEIKVGEVTKEAGTASFQALEKAVGDLKDGLIDGVVTAPINKYNIQQEGFNFAGHTEYFTEQFQAEDSLMFLCSETLRVGIVTGHIPLQEVSAAITKESILRKLKIMESSLREDFGIIKPKIAVLGLNPHAGEEGLLGREEKEIIGPAIDFFKNKGKLIFGPFPADGFFGNGHYKKFDGILAMYHDQGLVPFKTLAFNSGVNYTAGLPIVRTSPDHGTAHALSGKNIAKEGSIRAALLSAYDIIRNRKEYQQAHQNPLKAVTKEKKQLNKG